MLTALKALPLLWRLITIAGVLAALLGAVGGLYAYVRHQGYVAGHADATATCEADKRRMEEANRKAIADAERKLLEAERELTEKENELDALLSDLDLAADQEPDSGELCLSAGSVRRLTAIQ
jgi:hypothetical protein